MGSVAGAGVGGGFGGGAQWSLKSIPSLVAEYWSDLGVTVATGVSAWADQSGVSGVPWVQGTAASQPAIEVAGWADGGKSILFDGTDDFLAADGLATYFTGDDKPFSMIMLCQVVTVATGKRLWCAHTSSLVEAYMTAVPAHATFRYSAGLDFVERNGGTPDTDPHVMSWVFSGTALSLFIDGIAVINAAAMDLDALSISKVSMGTYQVNVTGAYNGNIRVAHASLYSAALSATQREQAEAFIVARRGV